MKKVVALVIVVVVLGGNVFAQSYATPAFRANWHEGAKGAIAQVVHEKVSQDGKYNYTYQGQIYILLVDIVNQGEYQIEFAQFANRNRNNTFLKGGEKVFIWWKKGSAEGVTLESFFKGNYNNFLERFTQSSLVSSYKNIALAKCANDIKWIAPVVTTKVVTRTVEVPVPTTPDTVIVYREIAVPAAPVVPDTVYRERVIKEVVAQQGAPANHHVCNHTCGGHLANNAPKKQKVHWTNYANFGLNLLNTGLSVANTVKLYSTKKATNTQWVSVSQPTVGGSNSSGGGFTNNGGGAVGGSNSSGFIGGGF